MSYFRGGHYFGWEGHNFFPSCLGEGHNFFQGFLGEGHNFFKVFFFIEKINYEYSAAVEAGFRFLLTYYKEKMSRRQKQNDLYQFSRTIWHLEGRSNR